MLAFPCSVVKADIASVYQQVSIKSVSQLHLVLLDHHILLHFGMLFAHGAELLSKLSATLSIMAHRCSERYFRFFHFGHSLFLDDFRDANK